MHAPSTNRFRELLQIAEVPCELRSNAEPLLSTLEPWILKHHDVQPKLTLTVCIEPQSAGISPTRFRGMEHLVLARFGESTFLFDLARNSVHGWISEAVARDQGFWTRRIMPLVLGVMGCAVGVLPLHSACVVRNGRGVLLGGASMAGKSTLAVALAKQGYEFLSDDWVYVRRTHGEVTVHGLDVPIKLLADAPAHFPELRHSPARPTANGELGYELMAESQLGLKATRVCSPQMIFFLERVPSGHEQAVRVSRSYVRDYINNSVEQLPHSLPELLARRQQLIDAVITLPAWRFCYSGSPEEGALYLSRILETMPEVTH